MIHTEIKEELRTIRYIEYDGIRFYEDKKGYWIGQVWDEAGKPHRVRLHVYVWEKFNGPVPEGYDIHHIDHDPSNNEIENLIALPESEHHRLHMAKRNTAELTKILETYAVPKAVEWHKSDEGKAWHREQYQKSLAPHLDERITLACQWCGKEYQVSPLMRSHSRFCSNKCKTAFRYHSGVDNVERICPVCGEAFVVNKYSRTKTCSKECANRLMSQTKIETHRRQG